MQTTTMNGDAGAAFKLPAVLNLAAAESFLTSVQQHAADPAPLRVDAAEVETLTLPCVQIMLAASRSHGRISVVNPSPEFLSAFADLGIDLARDFDCVQEEMPEQEQPAEMQTLPEGQSGTPVETSDTELQPMNGCAMSKRILTIDDSKTMRDMLMLTLAEAGFDVLQAVDGQDGLDVLVGQQVDVIITDINMPRMDGYEVIRQLRQKPEHKTTPILVLTTESEAEKRNLAREAGATGWMVKPFDPDRLVATVRKVAP
jgi:two-component system chemotaxis response regulator CheY